MAKTVEIPTESEWQIMEVLWNSKTPMTSKAVILELQDINNMTPKMIRVLMNRLCEKGIITYTVDPNDKRVYHYSSIKSREECQKETSRRFINSYFGGNKTSALATMVQSFALTDEQIQELEKLLEQNKGQKRG